MLSSSPLCALIILMQVHKFVLMFVSLLFLSVGVLLYK